MGFPPQGERDFTASLAAAKFKIVQRTISNDKGTG